MIYVQDRDNRAAQLALRVQIKGITMTVEEAIEYRLMIMTPTGGFDFDVKRINEMAEQLPSIFQYRRRVDREGLRFIGRVSEGNGFGLSKPAS